MTRNTPEILPYCQHCGRFKGVGRCENPECDKTHYVDIEPSRERYDECVICTTQGQHTCFRCGRTYCNKHAEGREETKLKTVYQHLGTCIVCGKVICEHCWIFNNSGFVTCLVHREAGISTKW